MHSDFEKILGELTRPSTSVVFGEKGSGKTAIRCRSGSASRSTTRRTPTRSFLINYDDLNQPVAELDARFGNSEKELAPFKAFRLVDHMDAMLAIAVDRSSAALLNEGEDRPAADLGGEPRKVARRWAVPLRHDLLLLQSLYDPADTDGHERSAGCAGSAAPARAARGALAGGDVAGWVPAAAMLFVWSSRPRGRGEFMQRRGRRALPALLAAYLGVLGKRLVWDRFVLGLARRVHARCGRRSGPRARSRPRWRRSIRTAGRTRRCSRWSRRGRAPVRDVRAAAPGRARFGYTGILVLVDRVDEPTLVNGDAEKMRAIIWPLFNNKFLQQERFGVKLLLPIELRHALFKESADFFQEARLDKQGFIERLSWTGPMLYDLCNARLNACRDPGGEPLSLIQTVRRGRHAAGPGRRARPDAPAAGRVQVPVPLLERALLERDGRGRASGACRRLVLENVRRASRTVCSSSTGASRRPELRRHGVRRQGPATTRPSPANAIGSASIRRAAPRVEEPRAEPGAGEREHAPDPWQQHARAARAARAPTNPATGGEERGPSE
jgi:hypothetical protein